MTMPDPTVLLNRAADACAQAYCPYSEYRVGAALLTTDGKMFDGCNVENASYGLTVCAERVAFFTAVADGHRDFTALALVADERAQPQPCGACRQVMAEFCSPDFPIYTAREGRLEAFERSSLGELLPKAFGLRGA